MIPTPSVITKLTQIFTPFVDGVPDKGGQPPDKDARVGGDGNQVTSVGQKLDRYDFLRMTCKIDHVIILVFVFFTFIAVPVEILSFQSHVIYWRSPAKLATMFPVVRSTMAIDLSEQDVATNRAVMSVTAQTSVPSSSPVPETRRMKDENKQAFLIPLLKQYICT